MKYFKLSFFLLITCFGFQSLKGISLENGNESPSNKAEIQNLLRSAEDNLNKKTEASLDAAFDALEESTKTQYNEGIVKSNRIIGENYINQANYPEGYKYLIKALDLSDANNLFEEKASILNSLGSFYLMLNQNEKAINYFEQGLQISKANQYKSLLAQTSSNLASAYEQNNKLDKVENLIQTYLPLVQELKNKRLEAFDFEIMGDLANSRMHSEKALDYFQKSYTLYDEIKDEKDKIKIFIKLGKTFLQKEDPAKAEVCFQNALLSSHNNGYPNLEMVCYEQLAKVYNMTGNFLRAEQDYQKFMKLKDSTESLSRFLVITQLNSNQVLQNKQKNIEQLLLERNKAESLNTTRNFFFTILGILFIGLLGLLWVVFRQLRNKRKVNILLSNQKEQLESLNLDKDRLFSIISHDLRSPLANLEAILRLIDTGDLSIEEVLELVGQLTNDVQETSIMLDNLLQWSNSQMKGIPPKYEQVDLLKIAEETRAFLRPQSEKKSISIQIESMNSYFSFSDREMIKLIVRNLTANAIKFTPNHGKITIRIERNLDQVYISVSDTGIGISQENLDKIFSNKPITTRGTQNEKGTGLGILLCRNFVEKNNGKLWAKSELGKGTTFTFSLPLNLEKVGISTQLETMEVQ